MLEFICQVFELVSDLIAHFGKESILFEQLDLEMTYVIFREQLVLLQFLDEFYCTLSFH